MKWIFGLLIVLLGISCQNQSETPDQLTSSNSLFTSMKSSFTNVDFQNKLVETEASNYYKYMYSYIGGGVAVADFNNDGLQDLFFVSNQEQNKLFLNQGDLKFIDVTLDANITHKHGFDTGVTVVDLNQDGWLDIYLTRGGWIQDNDGFANMLFINTGDIDENGIPSFTERAADYGLADTNRGIQSTFFDYDKDGDLDLFIANAPDFDDPGSEIVDLIATQKDPATLQLKGSDQLYQNNGNKTFKNVSNEAGILPEIGFGLNPQVGDLNQDGWLDIYVCNDFRIPDYVYLNNTDGTFREGRNEILNHMSFNSMGSDIADINNDGLMDIYSLDMNPEDYIRSKTTMGMTPLHRFNEMVEKDYHHQYMHNMLQINTNNGAFSEVSKLAGLADTDWSWSCLLADFNLDGWNDVYVTNGVFRDVIDRDANNNILSELRAKNRKPTDADFLAYAKMLPQQKLTNYIFKNNGDLTFEDVSASWTEGIPTFSNGASYADLDNDGDLEIIVNNINQEATILRNNAIDNKYGQFVKVKLIGPPGNQHAVGATVQISLSNNTVLTRQVIRTRGFLSSVPGILHFGIGTKDSIQNVDIVWPDGKSQQLNTIPVNHLATVNYGDAQLNADNLVKESKLIKKESFNFKHTDPSFDDYSLQILLPHKLSQTGPALAVGDLNQDGIEDLFVGGGRGQSGQVLMGSSTGRFSTKSSQALNQDKQKEDVDACFFDADGDGDQDLYVVSGSYEFAALPKLLIDRLYLNDGNGNFTKKRDAIPEIIAAGSVVRPGDFDNDGDEDLFVATRVIPGRYPFSPPHYLLINDNGKFSTQTKKYASALDTIGMITDAVWTDIDQDSDLDLIVTGEWMGIEVFENDNNQLSLSKKYKGLSSKKGWWNALHIEDMDGDGDMDVIAGNLGLNSKFHASPETPFHVYTNDFDYNGTTDVFLAKYYKDEEVPVRGKTCATQQLPHLANKIRSYNQFAESNLADIIGPGIKSAFHLTVNEFRSGIFVNQDNDEFKFQPFSHSVQRAPINSILVEDLDMDGHADILLAGNNHMPEIETTRYDAGIGHVLRGNGAGEFTEIENEKTGFWAQKDVRNMKRVNSQTNRMIVIANNNDVHELYTIK